MHRTRRYVLVALVGLIIVVGAWSINLFANRIAVQQLHYTTFSGAAPAPVTITPGSPTPVSATATPGAVTPTPTKPPGKPTPPPPPLTTDEQQIAKDVFQAINYARAAAGVPALKWSTLLVNGAHQHNLKMSAANTMSHQLPGEPSIGTRITNDGVQWTWCGENIGWTSRTNSDGALWLHNSMMAEQPPDDGHRKNILSTHYTMVGIDIYIDSNHKLWLTEDFAN